MVSIVSKSRPSVSVIVKTGCGTDGSFYSTTPYIIYWHNLWDDGGVGHGRQQGRLGGPLPRARAHHLRLGRRVRRVLRGAVEDLHNRGMYFIEMKNML